MTNDIWCKAWVLGQGGAAGAPTQTGTGSLNATAHQVDATQKLNAQQHERDSQIHGHGGHDGVGGHHGMPSRDPVHDIGGTGGKGHLNGGL